MLIQSVCLKIDFTSAPLGWHSHTPDVDSYASSDHQAKHSSAHHKR